MEARRIALVGQPNAGKSTLFNVISDIKTDTSNFAGTSVKHAECKVNIYGDTYFFIDLPGTYSLNAVDPAEKVTLEYLMTGQYDLIVNVVDATLLTRSLEMTIELAELGLPMIIALNMADEARAKGLFVDDKALAVEFGIPVIKISALFGKGVKELVEKCYEVARASEPLPGIHKYTQHVENAVGEVGEVIYDSMHGNRFSTRFASIKAFENPATLPVHILNGNAGKVDQIRKVIELQHGTDSFEIISYERHHIAMKISESVSKFTRKKANLTDILDKFLMHPFLGYIGLFIFLSIIFGSIFYVGTYISSLMDPVFRNLSNSYEPLKSVSMPLWALVDGLSQGILGALGIVLPYFFPLVFLMSLFEETGYLARIAFLMDVFFHKIGLHGKSVAAFMLGIGCSVPAIYATRILESKRDRLITAILIPFIPCSARIAVIFALSAAFAGPWLTIVVFAFVMFVIAINGKLLSKFLKKPTGLILEIPELRLPNLRISLGKTYYKIASFFREAVWILVLGSIALSFIQMYNLAGFFDDFFSPILKNVLGLPTELGSTLFFGFFRKELILVMANQALHVQQLNLLPLTQNQAIVFIIFVTLYFPCFTTFIVLWKEFKWKAAVGSAILSIFVATGSALIFKIVLDFIKNI